MLAHPFAKIGAFPHTERKYALGGYRKSALRARRCADGTKREAAIDDRLRGRKWNESIGKFVVFSVRPHEDVERQVAFVASTHRACVPAAVAVTHFGFGPEPSCGRIELHVSFAASQLAEAESGGWRDSIVVRR